MNIIKETRVSLKTIGRKDIPKGWHENRSSRYQRPGAINAPANYRRSLVLLARHKENHHLANHIANNLESYEPLHIAKRDVNWLWF
jgi:hypothetical protein